MNPNELSKQVDELRNEISKMRSDFDAYKKNTEGGLASVINSQQTHTHGGLDRSQSVYNDGTFLKPGQQISTGNFSMAELTSSTPLNPETVVMRGFFILGEDQNASDGVDNAQLTLEHQPSTDGSTNQTFYYGYRKPLFIGSDGVVASGGTLTTNQYSFDVDGLTGAFIQASHPVSGTLETYEISSNTAHVVTINGSWSFSSSSLTYTIFMPIYFGAAEYPWRRLYTLHGIDGGIRFGVGATNSGQNALLYIDESTGQLRFRKIDGSTHSVNLTAL